MMCLSTMLEEVHCIPYLQPRDLKARGFSQRLVPPTSEIGWKKEVMSLIISGLKRPCKVSCVCIIASQFIKLGMFDQDSERKSQGNVSTLDTSNGTFSRFHNIWDT